MKDEKGLFTNHDLDRYLGKVKLTINPKKGLEGLLNSFKWIGIVESEKPKEQKKTELENHIKTNY
jgi:hypothetical protein